MLAAAKYVKGLALISWIIIILIWYYSRLGLFEYLINSRFYLDTIDQLQKLFNKISTNYCLGNKFLGGDDFFSNYFAQFKEYLATLTTQELCIVINMIGSFLIFYCLISIIFIFFGSNLINKLNLEIKYPKLSKFISLRNKLQKFYLASNIFTIFVTLIVLNTVNIVTLIYG